MNFREKRLLRGLSPSEIGYIRGLVARKVRIAAESEISQILSEVETRIRERIRQDVNVEVGEAEAIHDMPNDLYRLKIDIHITENPNKNNGTELNVSGLSGPSFEHIKRR